MKYGILAICSLFIFVSCKKNTENIDRAKATIDSLYSHYGVEDEALLRETYPFKEEYKATYLNREDSSKANKFAFLWPFSGTFSAANAIYFSTNDQKYLDIINNKVLKGLEQYFDTERYPFGYASYINRALLSDRFYDDNVWIGIDYIDLYLYTKEPKYLDKAQLVWDFVYSGHDDKLGGGIYWVESDKVSKNTCSNAPAVVFALKLYEATKNQEYLKKAITLYDWTKENLQDPTDYLYYDNITLEGEISEMKYAYNSGQMLQAAALLYQITEDESYLIEAKRIAESCHNYFFHQVTVEGETFNILNKGNVWFSVVMVRGFLQLYKVDKNKIYINSLQHSLEHAWEHMRDKDGLFETDWEGKERADEKWLLTQAAMVEMYANLSNIK